MKEQGKQIEHNKELCFTILATPKDYHVDYTLYEIEYWDEIGEQEDPVYRNEEGTYTKDIEKANVYAHGFVKWDGCSNWEFDEQERGMLHGCDRKDLIRLGEVLARCWDKTAELCTNWWSG